MSEQDEPVTGAVIEAMTESAVEPAVEPAVERVTVSRRDALRALGLTVGGVAAATVMPAACAPNASPARQGAAATPGSATAAGATIDTAAAGSSATHTFFTPHEHETVTMLVDYIIPRDARSGSATDAGVPAWMDAFLANPDTEEPFRLATRGGLAWLDAESERRTGVPFVRATDAARRAILDDIAYPKRARPEMSHGVAFFNRFRDFTASGFFSSKMGQQDVQYLGDVAVPVWNGCPPAALAKLGVSYDLMATRVAPRTGGVRA